MHEQTHEEQHEENEEANFRDAGGGKRNSAESQGSGNQSDQQENQRVIQHFWASSVASRADQNWPAHKRARESPFDARC
jgi:hypothetical protein